MNSRLAFIVSFFCIEMATINVIRHFTLYDTDAFKCRTHHKKLELIIFGGLAKWGKILLFLASEVDVFPVRFEIR